MLKNGNGLARTKKVAVLSYHKVGEPAAGGWKTWFYIPEKTFADHLRFLQDDGWQAIDIRTFLRGMANPDTLPDRSCLITFDDGYSVTMQIASDWLQRMGCPAVLFMSTDFIGSTNGFDWGVEPEERMCDWDELRGLRRAGVSIESHCTSHRRLSELTVNQQREELTQSKATLESNLDSPVEVIAFPFGDAGDTLNESASLLRNAGYRAAFTYGGGPVSLPTTSPFHLSRLAMGPNTKLDVELASAREGQGT